MYTSLLSNNEFEWITSMKQYYCWLLVDDFLQFDLVELAEQVEKADQFTRATAGSKLQIIAEQVNKLSLSLSL